MPAGNGFLLHIETYFDTFFAILDTLDALIVLTVSDLGSGVERKFTGFRDPVPVDGSKLGRIELQFRFGPDGDGIACDILGDHEECGTSSDLDPLSLTDGIAEGSLVLSEHIPMSVENISRFFVETLLEEFFHAHLPYKAEPLTIPAIRIRKSRFFGDFTNLELIQVSDREECMSELKLVEPRQEVRLILEGIDSLEEMITRSRKLLIGFICNHQSPIYTCDFMDF